MIVECRVSFENANETLHHLNKIENFLYSKNVKNIKQTKIDHFFKVDNVN